MESLRWTRSINHFEKGSVVAAALSLHGDQIDDVSIKERVGGDGGVHVSVFVVAKIQ